VSRADGAGTEIKKGIRDARELDSIHDRYLSVILRASFFSPTFADT
jgi:hypothetical protein